MTEDNINNLIVAISTVFIVGLVVWAGVKVNQCKNNSTVSFDIKKEQLDK